MRSVSSFRRPFSFLRRLVPVVALGLAVAVSPVVTPVRALAADDDAKAKRQIADQVSRAIKQGRKSLRNGELNEAEKFFQVALNTDPTAHAARCGLAMTYIKERRLGEAYHEAKKVTEAAPEIDQAHAIMGLALVRGGNFPLAYTELTTALKLNKRNDLALAAIAEIACYENQLDTAINFLFTALDINSDEPDYQLLLARLASRRENFSVAADALKAFLRLTPKADAERRARIEGVIRFYNYLGTTHINVVQGKPDTVVPLEVRGRRPHVKVMINGKGPFDFVLDTGASVCVLAQHAAEKLGLKPVASGGFARAVGGNGTFPIVYGLVKSLEIGPVKLSTVPVYLRDLQGGRTVGSDMADGFLGLSALNDFLVNIDYKEHQLGLRYAPRRNTPGENASDASVVTPDPSGTTVPFRLTESGLISVETQLEEGAVLNFIFDSGASTTVISESIVNRQGWREKIVPEHNVRIVGAAGVMENVLVMQAASVRVFDLVRANARLPILDLTRLNESAGFEQGGILGGDFLFHCRIQIDFRRQQLLLTPLGPGVVRRSIAEKPSAQPAEPQRQ
jgi:predicted aspartyl protease/Tfp pilus assembly protein PilF